MRFRVFKETSYSFIELERIKEEFIKHVCVRSKLTPFEFDIKTIYKYPIHTRTSWVLPTEVLAACILESENELIPFLINYRIMDALVPFDERRKIEKEYGLQTILNHMHDQMLNVLDPYSGYLANILNGYNGISVRHTEYGSTYPVMYIFDGSVSITVGRFIFRMPMHTWEEVMSLFSEKLFADKLSGLRSKLLEKNNYSEISKQVSRETSMRFWRRFYAKCLKPYAIKIASEEELKLLGVVPFGCLDLFALAKRNSALPKPYYFIEVKAATGTSLGLSSGQRKFMDEFLNKVGILILHMQYSVYGICLRYLFPQSV